MEEKPRAVHTDAVFVCFWGEGKGRGVRVSDGIESPYLVAAVCARLCGVLYCLRDACMCMYLVDKGSEGRREFG